MATSFRSRPMSLLAAGLIALAPRIAPGQDSLYSREHYDKAEYMVPMRDGVRLYTIVYTSKDTSARLPILLNRTPYGIPPYGRTEFRRVLGPSAEFDREGYIVAYQDVRGKFRSEGEFRVMNPYKRNKRGPKAVDESSDTYDTIDWLLANIPRNNGRVGQWGISYPGWQTVMGMIDAHPALRASSPQASPSDMFVGDDFHHNGAFRFMYTFNWLSGNARPRTAQGTEGPRGFDYGTTDGYRFFMDVGTVGRVNELYFHDQLPTWNDFLEHPNYDSYWQDQNALRDLKGITHPVLNVAGWFDQEDFYGPMSIYYTLEKENPRNQSTLVVGPWNHGGWASTSGDSLGPVKWGSSTSRYFQREVQLPFFQRYLKDASTKPLPEAVVFESGSNVWRSYDSWPPKRAATRRLYFQAGGKLSFSPPREAGPAFDSYVSDPAKPVPFTQERRPTQGYLWMVEDQRFASTRPDVLVYQTEPLTEDLTIAGPVMARMRVATSGTDTDFIVKLVDVFPGNDPDPRMSDYQMMVGADVFRAKYRNSYTTPRPMVPNTVTPLQWNLQDKNHTFRKGHRVMVQVQSTWFPLIDRNPNQFMDIYQAKLTDFRKATQQVHRSASQPSHLEIHVMP